MYKHIKGFSLKIMPVSGGGSVYVFNMIFTIKIIKSFVFVMVTYSIFCDIRNYF